MSAANEPFDRLTSDEIAEPELEPEPDAIEPPPPPRVCLACGDAVVIGDLCLLCGTSRREKEAQGHLDRMLVEMKACIESTSFRCSCGEKVMAEGGRCGACEWKEVDRRERLNCVGRTEGMLPARYRGNHLQGPEIVRRVRDKRAIEQAQTAALKDEIMCIVLTGPPGAGKTSLACGILLTWAFERKSKGQLVDARTLSLARARSKLGEEPLVVEEAFRAEALALDDLGLDSPSEHGSAVLDVIYRRHLNSRLLVATLACSAADLDVRYGGGIARRLIEAIPSNVLIEVRP